MFVPVFALSATLYKFMGVYVPNTSCLHARSNVPG